MGLVNNTITDMMDEMVHRQASDMFLQAGKKVRYLKWGNVYTSDKLPSMEPAEIIADMDALGIDIKEMQDGYYDHFVDDGSNINHRLRLTAKFDDDDDFFVTVRLISSTAVIPMRQIPSIAAYPGAGKTILSPTLPQGSGS